MGVVPDLGEEPAVSGRGRRPALLVWLGVVDCFFRECLVPGQVAETDVPAGDGSTAITELYGLYCCAIDLVFLVVDAQGRGGILTVPREGVKNADWQFGEERFCAVVRQSTRSRSIRRAGASPVA